MTRKFLGLAAALIMGSGLMLSAQQSGGFTGPGLQAVTIQDARNLRDDTPVLLRGHILRYLGDEKYLFSDETGTIIIEIDDRLWWNISVNENDLVEISGEIDRDFRRVEIEVNRIRKL